MNFQKKMAEALCCLSVDNLERFGGAILTPYVFHKSMNKGCLL